MGYKIAVLNLQYDNLRVLAYIINSLHNKWINNSCITDYPITKQLKLLITFVLSDLMALILKRN